jgi:hypothetical protein
MIFESEVWIPWEFVVWQILPILEPFEVCDLLCISIRDLFVPRAMPYLTFPCEIEFA